MSADLPTGWTVARRTAVASGAVLLLFSYMLLTGGIALLWSEHADREGGYVWSHAIPGVTSGYAVTSDDVHRSSGGVQQVIDDVVSEVRLQVTPTEPTDVLFVGLASSADVAGYLHGVAHRQVGDIGQGGEVWGWLGPGVTTDRAGGPPAVPPGETDIWLTQSSGVGTRSLTWPRADGDWVVVVMQADGGAGMSVTVRTGAAAPHLGEIAGGMVLVGLVTFAISARLVRKTAQLVRQPTSGSVEPTPAPGAREPAAESSVPALTGR